MKKLSSSLLLMFVTSAFLMFACGDDEDPKKNQFTVEGESYELSQGFTFLSEEDEDEDGNPIFVHVVYLTGKDLEISDDDGIVLTGNDDIFAFALVSPSDEIEEDTYEIDDDEVAGTIPQVLIYTDYEAHEGGSPTYDGIFGGTDGTIKISKSGDKYTFEINITEFQTVDEEGATVDGEGSIKGYFRGELEVFENDALRKPKDSKNPLTDILNF